MKSVRRTSGPTERISEIRVLVTMLGGRIVFESEDPLRR
jgi:hypothetical protein